MNNPIWTLVKNGVDIVTLAALEREFGVRLSAEDAAMLAALFSRDPRHPRVHVAEIAAEMGKTWTRRCAHRGIRLLEKIVARLGSARAASFMEKFYTGYAHKSIADCGSTTIFFVGVSALAAKALEDSPLFSGQEPSSRYISFLDVPVWEPTGHPAAEDAIRRLMDLYSRLEEPVLRHVAERYPRREGENEASWRGAVKARGFDIRRAFLPAGFSTNVAWHGNLRQLADHLIVLRHHPLEEVRSHANRAWAALRIEYPSSFPQDAAMLDVSGERAKGRVPEVEAYRAKVAEWRWGGWFDPRVFADGFEVVRNDIDLSRLSSSAADLLSTRPRGAILPSGLGKLGSLTFQIPLDWGSYRDLHRQRNGAQCMPLLSPGLGFESWYLEQLPEECRADAELVIQQVVNLGFSVVADYGAAAAQYMLPMGFKVPFEYACTLPQAVYVCELRTSKTVHPTARRVAQELARYLQARLPLVKLHADLGEGDWTVARGNQTIVKKEEDAA